MRKISYIISRIPIFLFLSVVVLDLIVTNNAMTDKNYESVYYYMNEILNTSIVTNVFILLAVYRYKLCLYNKVSVFALLSLNVFNIVFMTIDVGYEIYHIYSYIFTHALMVPTAMLAIILMIKKI